MLGCNISRTPLKFNEFAKDYKYLYLLGRDSL
jgi:hypothetical protein